MIDNLHVPVHTPVLEPIALAETQPMSSWHQMWRALFLDEEVYQSILHSDSPAKVGARVMIWLLSIAGAARALSLLIHIYVGPRYVAIQTPMENILALDGSSATLLDSVWRLFEMVGIFPSWQGILFSLFATYVCGFAAWWLYAHLAHSIARGQGAFARKGVSASKGGAYGVTALSFTPLLLLLVAVVPGVHFPLLLIWTWSVLIQFQGFKAIYALSWPRTLAVTLGPHLIIGLVSLGILLGGTASLLAGAMP